MRLSAWKVEQGGWVSCGGVPLEDRGFRYGMSVFETVALLDGRPLFYSEHRERLRRALDSLGWAEAELPEDLPEAVADPGATGVWRWYVTAGPGAAADGFAGGCHGIFEATGVGTDFPALRMATSAAPYLSAPGGWKTGNYWQNIRAVTEARAEGADEAVLFDPCGALVSVGMGNLFLEVDGRWQTPAMGTGARDGVVRAWVLGQMAVEEGLLDAEAVRRATGAFVTNSRVGVRAVGWIDGRPLATDVAVLREAYRKDVLAAR